MPQLDASMNAKDYWSLMVGGRVIGCYSNVISGRKIECLYSIWKSVSWGGDVQGERCVKVFEK